RLPGRAQDAFDLPRRAEVPVAPARDPDDDDVALPGALLRPRRHEDVSRQLPVLRGDEAEIARRVVRAHDGLACALQNADHAALSPLAPPLLLDPRDHPVAVHRGAETIGGDEEIGAAILRHDEARAAPDRLEPSDDEVDALRRRVALPLDAVERALGLEPVQERAELRVVRRTDAQRTRELLRLQRAARLRAQVVHHTFRRDHSRYLRGAGMRIDIVKRSPSASGRRPLSIRIPGVPSCAARTLAVINPSTALAGWLARITPSTAVGSRSAPSLSWISARNPVARADCCATTGERRRRGALRASPRGAVASGPRRRVARAPRAPPAAPPRQE